MSGVENLDFPTEELSFSQNRFLAVEIWEDQKQTGTLQLKRRGDKKKRVLRATQKIFLMLSGLCLLRDIEMDNVKTTPEGTKRPTKSFLTHREKVFVMYIIGEIYLRQPIPPLSLL